MKFKIETKEKQMVSLLTTAFDSRNSVEFLGQKWDVVNVEGTLGSTKTTFILSVSEIKLIGW